MALINKLNAIGDAIREKTGKEDLLTLDQMPDEIRSISGGSGGGLDLNFKVEWYASEDLLPETAEENTIAVISDQEIANWVFSSTEPSAAADGDVWFCTAASSGRPFDAVASEDENSLYVYVLAAKQLAQADWQDVSIRIYQNGEWHTFNKYLFYWGNTCDELTGGWQGGTSITDTIYGEYWYAPTTIGGTSRTVNKIDLRGSNTIYFKCESVSAYCFAYLNLGDGGYLAQTTINQGVCAMDISSINDGFYYLYFTCSGVEGGCKYRISEIWLE